MKFELKETNVITPDNGDHKLVKLDKYKNSIFLAGPCPRDDYDDDWRFEAIDILDELGFDGYILNPTNENYDENDSEYLSKQTAWENEAMHKASAIVFWIERSEEHPAFTTNIEFGQWFDKDGIYVGWTDNAIKNSYLEVKLESVGKQRFTSLKELLEQVVTDLDRPAEKFFISDTHLGQERTLELSQRPFRNVEEMDLTLISNWNKLIRKNDEVYFLGDFGDNFDYLNMLNYGTLHFVLGNYERVDRDGKDIKEKSIEELSKYPNVTIYEDRGGCLVELSNGQEVICMHEPLDPDEESDFKDSICLYGHIHGRQFYKRNGTDVGCDIHYYKPLSEEEIIWRLNAIQYLDENVWTEYCI